jgi:flagellar hook-associated protein 2
MVTPLASFSGLATGLDSASLVDGLVRLARRPIAQLESRKKDNDARVRRLEDLRSRLQTLENTARALDEAREASPSRASSSRNDLVTVTGSGGGTVGSYQVSVTSMARASRTYSDAFASKDDAGVLGVGTLTVQVGSGPAVDVEVTAEDSLGSLASKINSASAGVTAGLLFDGTAWRLQVVGNATGASNEVAFVESGVSLGLTNPANRRQAASDAVLQIDGFTVTSATNTVTNAIPGLTLEVRGEGGSPAEVRVERDPDALRSAVAAFVEAYNVVVGTIARESAAPIGGAGPRTDALSGDGTLRAIQSRLRSLVGDSYGTGPYRTLASVGVTTGRDGSLSLDARKLADALAADPDGVTRLFAGAGAEGGVFDAVGAAVAAYVRAGDGALTQRIEGFRSRNRTLNASIAGLERRLDKYEDTLRKQFTSLERIVGGLQAQGNSIAAILRSTQGQRG